MAIEGKAVAGKSWMWIVGWILSMLPILFMGPMAIAFALFKMDMVRKGITENGYKEHHAPLIIGLEIACAILYAIPQTAVLGAILLTGYFGGAIATHVRIDDPGWPFPLFLAVITWLGLFFRDARVRALTPIRWGV